jgi:hypothetical protein
VQIKHLAYEVGKEEGLGRFTGVGRGPKKAHEIDLDVSLFLDTETFY